MLFDKDAQQRETITKWPIWLTLTLLKFHIRLLTLFVFDIIFNFPVGICWSLGVTMSYHHDGHCFYIMAYQMT